jgi:TonB-dependent starch-binding outer membrane protein SusC
MRKLFMNKRFVLTLVGVLMVSLAFSQRTITGQVTDASTGETLPSVSIVIKGTTTGTVSNIDGDYSLSASTGDVLEFSYLGFKKQEVKVGNQVSINVALESETTSLDDVIVVGYGTMRKSDVTGAISSVDSEDIESTKSSNVIESLQGKVSGIDMTRSSGRAGSGFNIKIRGERSFSGSNTPIYIVDGVDFGSDVNINPNDIQSIEVLKDASSTAIYGSRGANGVILITTKKGDAGKPTVSFNTYYGVTQPLGKLPIGDSDYYIQMQRDMMKIPNRFGSYTGNINELLAENPQWEDAWDIPDELIDVTSRLYPSEIEGFENGTNFDWVDAQMEDFGTQQDYHLSISGGTAATNYQISLNNFVEDTYIPGDDLERYSLKASINSKVNEFIEVGTSSFLSYSENRRGNDINYHHIPLVQPYDSVGNIITEPNERVPFMNPLIDQNPRYNQQEILKTRMFTSFFGQLNFTDWLNFRTSFNADLSFERDGEFVGKYEDIDRNNEASITKEENYKWTWTNTLDFNKTFGIHRIGTMLGTETMQSIFESTYQRGTSLELETGKWYNIGSATGDRSIVSTDVIPYEKRQLSSFFGRFNYSLMDKYLLTLSARYDGASQLTTGYKWDFFPAASIGWRMTEESFMQNLYFISNMKLRVGYGVSGNQSVDPYSTLGSITEYPLYYEFGDQPAFGYRDARVNNPVGWEQTKTTNIGLDFGFFANRISGSLEIYQSDTYDILQQVSLPPTSAIRFVVDNIGESRNKGVELSMRTVNVSTNNFEWTTDFTFSSNNEEITHLAGGVQQDISNGWFVGHPMKVWYDYEHIGIWQEGDTTGMYSYANYGREPGDIKLNDLDGDTAITEKDRLILGNPRPDWTGGFSSRITYKNLDFSFFVYARMGQMIADGVITQWSPDGRENPMEREYWTPNNPINTYPRVNPDLTRSGWSEARTLMYTDGSFVKIKDITLGYTIPNRISQLAYISKARFYVSVKNAFAFGEYFDKGRYDPEYEGRMGIPTPKMYSAGLNVTF